MSGKKACVQEAHIPYFFRGSLEPSLYVVLCHLNSSAGLNMPQGTPSSIRSSPWGACQRRDVDSVHSPLSSSVCVIQRSRHGFNWVLCSVSQGCNLRCQWDCLLIKGSAMESSTSSFSRSLAEFISWWS